MKLNIGAGTDIHPWYINMDIVQLPGIDVIHNLEEVPYPFEDNTFDEIFCSHVLEHVFDLQKTMRELVRICKNGALIKVKVPYVSNPNGWADPTHHRLFSLNSFYYFSKECFYNANDKGMDIQVLKKRIHFFSNAQYLKSDIINILPDFFVNLIPKVYERFFAFWFPSTEIHFLLKVNK